MTDAVGRFPDAFRELLTGLPWWKPDEDDPAHGWRWDARVGEWQREAGVLGLLDDRARVEYIFWCWLAQPEERLIVTGTVQLGGRGFALVSDRRVLLLSQADVFSWDHNDMRVSRKDLRGTCSARRPMANQGPARSPVTMPFELITQVERKPRKPRVRLTFAGQTIELVATNPGLIDAFEQAWRERQPTAPGFCHPRLIDNPPLSVPDVLLTCDYCGSAIDQRVHETFCSGCGRLVAWTDEEVQAAEARAAAYFGLPR